MKTEPQKEHRWLQKLVGDWTYEWEASMGPDQPPMKSKGTQSVRSLGGLWILGEGEWEMPDGSPATSILTLGFDTLQKRFVGTWIGSMMTYLWVYDGVLNEDETTLVLDAEGPGMAGDGQMAKYQDIVEVQNENYWLLKSQIQKADGKWQQFMVAHYRRRQ